MARRIIIGILVFLSTAGFVWADEDVSDTDLADTAAKEVKIQKQKPFEKDSDTYRVGRSNIRMNKKSDSYNWKSAGGEEDDAVPLGNAYGVGW